MPSFESSESLDCVSTSALTRCNGWEEGARASRSTMLPSSPMAYPPLTMRYPLPNLSYALDEREARSLLLAHTSSIPPSLAGFSMMASPARGDNRPGRCPYAAASYPYVTGAVHVANTILPTISASRASPQPARYSSFGMSSRGATSQSPQTISARVEVSTIGQAGAQVAESASTPNRSTCFSPLARASSIRPPESLGTATASSRASCDSKFQAREVPIHTRSTSGVAGNGVSAVTNIATMERPGMQGATTGNNEGLTYRPMSRSVIQRFAERFLGPGRGDTTYLTQPVGMEADPNLFDSPEPNEIHAVAVEETISSPIHPAESSTSSSPALRRSRRKRIKRNLDSASTDERTSCLDEQKKPAVDKNSPKKKAFRKCGSVDVIKTSVPDVIKSDSCCICLEVALTHELSKISGCAHMFCYSCIERWADRENTCPLCKSRFCKIERVNKITGRKRKGDNSPKLKNSKRVKNRDQRADLSANALQGLLANMENGSLPQSLAQFIFSNVTGGLTAPMGNGFSQGRRSGVQPPLSFAMPVGTAFSARGARDGRSFRVVTRDGASGATGIYAQAPNSHNVTHVNDVGGGSSAATSRGGFENFFPRNSFGTSLGGFVNNVEEEGDERNVIDFDPFIGEETDDDGEEEYYYNYVDVEQRVGNFDRVRNLSELRNPFLQRYRREGGDRQFSPRSFALNSHDRSAGVSAENALHIDDSDDDDVVEIVNMS